MSKEKPTSPFLLERRAAFVTVGANIMQAGHVHPTVGNVKVNYIRISAVDIELFALSTKGSSPGGSGGRAMAKSLLK